MIAFIGKGHPTSHLLSERVFIHHSEICGSSGVSVFGADGTVGISINFELEYDRDRKRYHAVKARWVRHAGLCYVTRQVMYTN